jgi:hypothetical protein
MWAHGGEYTAYCEWVEFLRVECGYERDGRVDYARWEPWLQATMHGGIRIMHEQFCIVSDRPRAIHMETVNGRGRLHRLDGPAKVYGDGWGIYAVHGVRVPSHVILAPEAITAAEIQAETNAEVRRVMIDRYGAARYLAAIEATVRHEDVDQFGFPRRLLEADIGDVEPLVMVEVVNSTPEPIGYAPDANAAGTWVGQRWHKIYSLRVDPKCRTTREALAWTFEMPESEYAPAVET